MPTAAQQTLEQSRFGEKEIYLTSTRMPTQFATSSPTSSLTVMMPIDVVSGPKLSG
jgi:hypothetical protein